MREIFVNTDRIAATASKINSINNQIKNRYQGVENAMKNLDNSWDGKASVHAMEKFHSIRSNYEDSRYNVLLNYVHYLEEQVSEGYKVTEGTNESLAAAFK